MNGGPGAIRTPGPQIRSLHEGVESKGFLSKPVGKQPLSFQGVTERLQTEKRHGQKENPGALAGATGATENITFHSEDYRVRAQCAIALAEAIGDCHPDDAVQLMTAAIFDLTPDGLRCDVFLSAEEDARWWASWADPCQLTAVLAAVIERLGDRGLHVQMRKRLLVRLFESMCTEDRLAFLKRTDPTGQFLRQAAQ